MNIDIKIIPQNEMRELYPLGDWWFDYGGDLHIRVSELRNWKYEVLVATHELEEALLCEIRGIKEVDIAKFDSECQDDEPGLNEKAPYHKEHLFATKIERQTAKELGVDWEEYDKEITEYY